MLRNNATTNSHYDLLINKEILEKNCAQLIDLARKHTQLSTSEQAICEPEINQLIDTVKRLHIYIENVDENISHATKEELYKFQNQLDQNDINEFLHVILRAFTKKQENSATWRVNQDAWNMINLIKANYTDAKNHLENLIENLMRDRNINEFDLFQQMETAGISQIKSHVEKGHELHGIDETTEQFAKALKMIPNINRQKKSVFLWAALLKEGVDYAKIYQFGLQQMPSPVGYADIGKPSSEDIARRKEREKNRRAIENEMKTYLNYLPLLTYHLCNYDNMLATIDTLRSNDQYASIIKRIELHSVLGNYVYLYNKFDKLRVAYGDGKQHHGNYDEQEDIAWLSAWRDKELQLMSQQAATYPELLEKINALKNNQIKVTYLGACVLVDGLGEIGAVMLALNAYEIKKLALTKTSVSHLSFFTNAPAAPDQYSPTERGENCCALL